MLAVIFPHMFEDVEFLLPQEDVIMSDVTNTYEQHVPATGRKGRAVQENAVAGPSRLRH